MADRLFQTAVDTPNSDVVALSRSVNMVIEAARLPAIIMGLNQLALWSPAIDPPTIMGSRGKTHGAMTVKTPARKETISNVTAIAGMLRKLASAHYRLRTYSQSHRYDRP